MRWGRKILEAPWGEVGAMGAALFLSFAALALLAARTDAAGQGIPAGALAGWMAAFLLLSLLVSLVSVVAGIGGGVLFTPALLAFTPIDSLLVRAMGLLLAMVSGLTATGILVQRGMGNLRLCLLMAASQGAGALLGALGAIGVYRHLGDAGEAAVRVSLGLLLFAVSTHLLRDGRPRPGGRGARVPDGFTERLRLARTYYEESENRAVEYRPANAGPGLLWMAGVGLVGGFFGMGAGWAIVPVLHLVMGLPIKIAAANSVVILGLGGAVAVWPYLLIGALIPSFALPWIAGQILGGRLGSLLLVRVRARFIRRLLIALLYFTAFSLVARGLEGFGGIRPLPPAAALAALPIAWLAVAWLSARDPEAR